MDWMPLPFACNGEYLGGSSGRSTPMWSFGRTRCSNGVNRTRTFQPMLSQYWPVEPNSDGLGLSQQ